MAIKIGESDKIREEWGDKPCSHPRVEKEIDWYGMGTGDVICTQCGAAFFGKDAWRKAQEKALEEEKKS